MKRYTFILLALVALVGSGCSHKADSRRWIRQAREANLQADQALQKNDHLAAVASLKNIVETNVPGNVAESDARAVRQDACFRLASIELDANRPQQARHWSNRGLELGRHQDLFTANLLVVRGRALQKQGLEVQAAQDYHQALVINESLLDQVLSPKQEGNQP